MLVRILKLLFVTTICCQNAFADSELEKSVANTVQTMIQQNQWPSLPSSNAKYIVSEVADADLDLIINQFNKVIFSEEAGFKIKFSNIGNVVCDSERKYIIADSKLLRYLLFQTPENFRSFTAAALLAHEMAHYLEKVATSRNLLQLKIFKYIVLEDNIEHAYVEVIAADILRRSGYSKLEMAIGFSYLFRAMSTIVGETTDLKTRRAVLNEWAGQAIILN